MVAFGGWEGRDLCGRGRSMAGAGDWEIGGAGPVVSGPAD